MAAETDDCEVRLGECPKRVANFWGKDGTGSAPQGGASANPQGFMRVVATRAANHHLIRLPESEKRAGLRQGHEPFRRRSAEAVPGVRGPA